MKNIKNIINIKIFAVELTLLLAIIAIYNLVAFLIKPLGLVFTDNVNFPYTCVLILLVFVMLLQVIIFLFRTAKKKTAGLLLRIAAGLECAVITGSLIIALVFLPYCLAFGFKAEHFVTKDGRRMVAYVDSFMEVEVKYYDYQNYFVRKNRLKIEEDYGSGGYDPFNCDFTATVDRSTYYDDEGRTIQYYNEK